MDWDLSLGFLLVCHPTFRFSPIVWYPLKLCWWSPKKYFFLLVLSPVREVLSVHLGPNYDFGRFLEALPREPSHWCRLFSPVCSPVPFLFPTCTDPSELPASRSVWITLLLSSLLQESCFYCWLLICSIALWQNCPDPTQDSPLTQQTKLGDLAFTPNRR